MSMNCSGCRFPPAGLTATKACEGPEGLHSVGSSTGDTGKPGSASEMPSPGKAGSSRDDQALLQRRHRAILDNDPEEMLRSVQALTPITWQRKSSGGQ